MIGGSVTLPNGGTYLGSSITENVVGGGSGSSENANKASADSAAPIMIGGTTFVSNPATEYVIGSQTLVPGGPAIMVSGTPVSLALSASGIIIGGIPEPITLTSRHAAPTLTLGSSIMTANSASQYVIGTQTLVPGAPAITVAGTLISLSPMASDIVIGGITQISGSPAHSISQSFVTISENLETGSAMLETVIGGVTYSLVTTILPEAPAITMGGSIVTVNSAGQYIYGSQTPIPGGQAITISETPVSLAPSASDVVVGGTTELLPWSTNVPGIGGYVYSALGGTPIATGTTQGLIATASGTRVFSSQSWNIVALVMINVLVAMMCGRG